MISTSSLVLDGHHGHGPGHGPHHMAFVEPYMRSKLPVTVPEFLRPLPKPAPLVPRFSARPAPSHSPRKEYSSVNSIPSSTTGPVNLTASKHCGADDQISRTSSSLQMPHLSAAAYTSRMFPHPGFYPSLAQSYGSIYSSPYAPLLNRPTYINSTPLNPLERQYSPPGSTSGPTPSSPVFLPPSVGYSAQGAPQPPPPPPPPPPNVKPGQSLLREKRPFKVPTGTKDSVPVKSRAPVSKPVPAKRVNSCNNNNLLPPNFTKGSLIQLGNGDLRRVEDVTTEDLVFSAERCPAFRLDPSTVVRIEEVSIGCVLITLSYGENRKTVEMESTLEHPYFVYGQGWASCSPDRTMNSYGLQCHRLQVGDICISLSPRQAATALHTSSNHLNHRKPTTTAVQSSNDTEPHRCKSLDHTGLNIDVMRGCGNKHASDCEEASSRSEPDHSDDEKNGKRRRYSAPDRFDAEDEYIDPGSPSPVQKRHKD